MDPLLEAIGIVLQTLGSQMARDSLNKGEGPGLLAAFAVAWLAYQTTPLASLRPCFLSKP